MTLTPKHLPYHVPAERLCCPHCKGPVERTGLGLSFRCKPCGIVLRLTGTMQKRMGNDPGGYPHDRWRPRW